MTLYRYRPLPVQISHGVHVVELSLHHNGPFNRLLIAQSQPESIPLMTSDQVIQRYELETIW